MEKKNKKFLEDEFERLRDLADVNPDSDIPVTEKLTKEKKRKEILDN